MCSILIHSIIEGLVVVSARLKFHCKFLLVTGLSSDWQRPFIRRGIKCIYSIRHVQNSEGQTS